MFDRGSQKTKLDRFLVYFQRYCLSKFDPPVDLEFDLQDLYELLRPNLKRFDNLEDACKAVEAMEREELEKLAKATQVETLFYAHTGVALPTIALLPG